jgi:hypothetical protein
MGGRFLSLVIPLHLTLHTVILIEARRQPSAGEGPLIFQTHHWT